MATAGTRKGSGVGDLRGIGGTPAESTASLGKGAFDKQGEQVRVPLRSALQRQRRAGFDDDSHFMLSDDRNH